MREEQASADSRFSRYVGHTGGGLFCISSLPCLFLCCLPLSRLHLISYSLTPFISGYLSVSSFTCFFVFWQTSVTVTHSCGRSGEQKKRVEREIKSERSCQWRQHFYWLSCFFQPLLSLIKGLPVVILPSVFATYVVNRASSFFLPSLAAF